MCSRSAPGSGYQTAVLAELAGEVYAIERIAPLAEHAREVLARLDYTNVHLAIGDGSLGWPEHAPFDGILVAAAATDTPQGHCCSSWPKAAGSCCRRAAHITIRS